MSALLPPNSGERRTLADVIFAKLDNPETSTVATIQKVQQGSSPLVLGGSPWLFVEYLQIKNGLIPRLALIPPLSKLIRSVLPGHLVEVIPHAHVSYRLGLFLHKYKSGPLPKLFKVIPSLPAWARMLALTSPESWSPHACRAATRIFISNMKPPQAQLFLGVVLLDAIREDIRQNKRLNVQYYEALKRALYKPGAFFKGIVFPMLNVRLVCNPKVELLLTRRCAARLHFEGGCDRCFSSRPYESSRPTCFSRSASHCGNGLLRCVTGAYLLSFGLLPSGPNSLFIRVLIDKKFELPYQVVDALVFHFIRISNTYKARSRGDSEKLPVLWHQSLLVFCQR